MNRKSDLLVLLGAVIAASTLIGFWVPFRRGQKARKAQPFDGIPQAKTMKKSV
jgi:hypothetical protein